MARTAMTKSDITLNAAATVTLNNINAGATGTSGYSVTGIEKDCYTLITVAETAGATGVFTFYASDEYSAKGIGDLSITVGGSTTRGIVLEGARFRQSDGSIYMGSGITGQVGIDVLPS